MTKIKNRKEPSRFACPSLPSGSLFNWKRIPRPRVGRFIVEKPLTVSQLRRLPKALKERLQCADDSVDELERLNRLEDTRT
jgi:hypothetical protein